MKALRKKNGQPCPTLSIVCVDEEAAKRLIINSNFTYEKDGKDTAIWVQRSQNNGPYIILDFCNAPPNRDVFLEGCFKTFVDVIKWKTSEKKINTWSPVDFKISRITRALTTTLETQKGKQNVRVKKEESIEDCWRVAFKPDEEKIRQMNWRRPQRAGVHGQRGEITIREPPFCDDCVSYSHHRRLCEWWREKSAVFKTSKPTDFLPTTWDPIKTFEAAAIKAGRGKVRNIAEEEATTAGDKATEVVEEAADQNA